MKIYKCPICGNVVELVNEAGGTLVCCGQNMKELVPGTSDGAAEKHVPVVEVDGRTVRVKVGEAEHPMMEAHYIQWIAIVTKEGSQRKYLKPGEPPVAEFQLTSSDEFQEALALCNLHGLWSAK